MEPPKSFVQSCNRYAVCSESLLQLTCLTRQQAPEMIEVNDMYSNCNTRWEYICRDILPLQGTRHFGDKSLQRSWIPNMN